MFCLFFCQVPSWYEIYFIYCFWIGFLKNLLMIHITLPLLTSCYSVWDTFLKPLSKKNETHLGPHTHSLTHPPTDPSAHNFFFTEIWPSGNYQIPMKSIHSQNFLHTNLIVKNVKFQMGIHSIIIIKIFTQIWVLAIPNSIESTLYHVPIWVFNISLLFISILN